MPCLHFVSSNVRDSEEDGEVTLSKPSQWVPTEPEILLF